MNNGNAENKRNRKGFTLVEIMTTVVIIGVIASIAIPQFMSSRMAANMEMVRQHMRIIGQKMNDIMTNKGEFPAEADWPLTGTIDPDELAVTASLSAIDDMCYTTDDYKTTANGKGYRFCSAPKLDACGRWAGNKRFCVHMDSQMSAFFAPGVVAELPYSIEKPWENAFEYTEFGVHPQFGEWECILPGCDNHNKNISPEDRLLNWIVQSAYFFDIRAIDDWVNSGGGYLMPNIWENAPWGYEWLPVVDYPAFEAILGSPSFQQKLAAENLAISLTKEAPDPTSDAHREEFSDQIGPDSAFVYMGIKFTNPKQDRLCGDIHECYQTESMYTAKKAELCADTNGTIFYPGSPNC